MNPRRAIGLIAWRDMVERMRSRAFLLSSGLILLFVVGFIAIPALIDDDEAPTYTFGLVGETPASFLDRIGQVLEPGAKLETRSFSTEGEAEQPLLDGDVDVVVANGAEVVAGPSTSESLISLTAATLGSIRLLERAQRLGLSEAELIDLVGSDVTVQRLVSEEDKNQEGNRNLAFFGSILLFISIVTYGQWILIGVIEEKSNRVVEVVLGTVKAHHLLGGKILGIGALGLAQLVLISAAALLTLATVGTVEVPATVGRAVAVVVLWFLLGFAFYATAFAAAGSLVSRQEEAQNASFPIIMVLLVGYFIATTSSFGGDNSALRIASWLPPSAPMTMPVRVAKGDAAMWEVAGSVALMVAATYSLMRLAGRIYSGGLLHSGTKIKMREAWRSAND